MSANVAAKTIKTVFIYVLLFWEQFGFLKTKFAMFLNVSEKFTAVSQLDSQLN